ncbi:MAG: CHAT domain-containing protein, partial [Cyanobacteria bacterium P01_D01_bin.116]
LKLAEEIKDTAKIMQAKLTLAITYLNLGEYDKFNQYSQQALTTARQIKEHPIFDTAALAIVMVNHFIQGDYQKTIDLAQEGLSISKNIGFSNYAKQFDVINLLFTGAGYRGLKDYAKAIRYSQKSLELSRKIKDRNLEFYGLIFSGSFYKSGGQKQQAINLYRQALALASETEITTYETYANIGLARVYRDLNQSNIAIAYYKKAVNGFEELRSNIKGLPKGIEESFLKSIQFVDRSKLTDIYRELAELLIAQGRQAEARQVLDLLKIQEIRDFAEGKTDVTQPQVPLTNAEKRITTKSESIIALSRQISECEKTNCKQKSKLYEKRTALRTEFNRELEKIEKEIRDRKAKDDTTFPPHRRGKVADIVKAQPDKVMIYPFVMEDKLWLLLYSGDVAKKFEVKVTRDELGNTVKQFRELMKECEKRAYCGAEDTVKIQRVSKKLYEWLIKPLAGELKQNKVRNLVFALDRVTRYLPMSALYDGKQYLIENYTIYNVLSADLTDTNSRLPAKIQDTQVLAMGVSNAVGGFSALRNVPTEVDDIVKTTSKDKGIYPGKEYLNQSFDYNTLRTGLTGKNILHLATHGEFVRDKDKASYLLLGNGKKLTIREIENLGGLDNIHLVVLSACQTALAAPRQDGVEIASLAYSFINEGAKSVIASLWQVADSSTSKLMQNFYKNIAKNKQKITKSEAMRLAQLQLLYNKDVTVDDIKRAGGLIQEEIPSSGKKSESKTFAHPYYWAPFVLIGNGL